MHVLFFFPKLYINSTLSFVIVYRRPMHFEEEKKRKYEDLE